MVRPVSGHGAEGLVILTHAVPFPTDNAYPSVPESTVQVAVSVQLAPDPVHKKSGFLTS